MHQVEQAIEKVVLMETNFGRGAQPPVLEGPNPARFSVLPVRKPRKIGSRVK